VVNKIGGRDPGREVLFQGPGIKATE
jgi:hypothetical protein